MLPKQQITQSQLVIMLARASKNLYYMLLIYFQGRSYAYDACGRGFTTLPAKYTSPEYDGLVTMLDIIIKLITEKVIEWLMNYFGYHYKTRHREGNRMTHELFWISL